MAQKTVKEKISAWLLASKDSVFLRNEFDRFGSYRQVSRALGDFFKAGLIVRVGYGVYAKGRKSSKALVQLDQEQSITMSERDFVEFSKAISEPFAPNLALRGALDAAQEVKRSGDIIES